MELLQQANSELQILIRQQVNEDLTTRDGDLQTIKNWLLQQPHLPDSWDDVRLLNFLRGCSFSLEKCKKKLDAYFTIRTAVPEFYSDRNFKNAELKKIRELVYQVPLPTLTNRGHRVHILRFKYNNVFGSIQASMKIKFMMLDLRLLLEEVGVAGDIYIMDAETLTANHALLLTPSILKKYIISIFEVYPMKVKEVHVINIHPFANTLYSFVKTFLNSKIKDRIHMHADGIESLYKFVPKEILPEEYGGNAGKLQEIHDPWMQKLDEYEQWFLEQENFKSDESKRPGKSISCGELLGTEGSFKKLSVD